MAALGLLCACLEAPPRVGPGRDGGGPSGDGGLYDAAAQVIDGGGCPTGCSACDLEMSTCRVDCSNDLCAAGATLDCPASWVCTIDCLGPGACSGGPVSCTGAGACEIDCSGTGACERSPVSCSGPTCRILCSGTDACDSGVDCNATECTIECGGPGACQDGGGACCGNADCGEACTAQDGAICACT